MNQTTPKPEVYDKEGNLIEPLICDVCGDWIAIHDYGSTQWREGHNAQPLADGRCCDTCNNLVIAERLNRIITRRQY